jgi:hypothetical protein
VVYIVTKSGGSKYGRTRAEIEDNLKKDGLSTMTDDQLDKCKYLEKKSREQFGGEIYITEPLIDNAEKIEE